MVAATAGCSLSATTCAARPGQKEPPCLRSRASRPPPTTRGTGWSATTGASYAFGDAQGFGSTATTKPISPVAAITPTPDGKGYWLLEPDDWSYSFTAPPPIRTHHVGDHHAVATARSGPDPDTAPGAYCNPYGPCEPWCGLFAHLGVGPGRHPRAFIPFTGSIYSWGPPTATSFPPPCSPRPGTPCSMAPGPRTPPPQSIPGRRPGVARRRRRHGRG